MKKTLLILLPLLFIQCAFAQVVQTQFGPIQGSQNGGVVQFLGVPFASPPVNDLRWKAPEDPTPWGSTLNTTAFAPACPQKLFQQGDTTSTLIGNEDCLYLNIWTPQTGAGNRAVMVFIHGGGNQQGSANEVNGGAQMYFGKNMAERGDVVVVTIQYRLGALGYMVHPGLEEENNNSLSGNYGSMDQILALQWVKNNISNFGVNVGNLLTSPLAAGLFQRACIQSATPALSSYANSLNRGIQFVNSYSLATGSNTQKIAYLRSLPADSFTIKSTSPLQGGVVQMNWQPTVDGYVFPGAPITVFQSGTFNKVPLMIGSNSEEMSLSSPQVVTPGMVNLLVSTMVPAPYQAQVLALYPPGTTNAEARQSYVGILSDMQFTVNTRRTAECVSNNQLEPVWRYFYTHKHTIAALQPYGSYHGMELFYVFNNWENATLGQGVLFKPADDSTQNVMLSYWTNFAKTGNPNGNGLVTWPEFFTGADCYLEIKATPNGSQCGIRTAKSDLWDDVVGFPGCTSSAIDEDAVTPFTLYPNPASNQVSINFDNAEPANLRVFDMSGRQVISLNKINSGYNLPTASLANGLYLLQVISEKGISTQKMVVQH
jgi:para-nitrobenzyl esterase